MSAFEISTIPGLTELWAETLGEPEISIAILDGPIDLAHPDLQAANIIQLDSTFTASANHSAASAHGTHVASIIFGNHNGAVKGVAPRCRGISIPIFKDKKDGGIAPCSQVDLARAISLAVDQGADVINISGGEFSTTGKAHPLLANAVQDCFKRGVLIVAAAGNQGCNCLHIPGALPSVIAVGAMDREGQPLEFSNWGELYQHQGILAPGSGIVGASPDGETALKSGTSYATPIVAGAAALLLSIQLKKNKKTKPELVRGAILGNTIGCDVQPVANCRRLLAGRLNLENIIFQITKGENLMSETKEVYESLLAPEAVENATTNACSLPQIQNNSVMAAEANGTVEKDNTADAIPTTISVSPQGGEVNKQDTAINESVVASSCGCSSNAAESNPIQMGFVLGQIGFDLRSEARRDSIQQHMEPASVANGFSANPHDPAQMLTYLSDNPWEAASITWTLNLDSTPLYAIQAQGPYANEVYQRLREFLREQSEGRIERISLGGYITGEMQLLSGQVVPVIWPEIRCMYSWNTAELIKAVCGEPPAGSAKVKDKDTYQRNCDSVVNFLQRVYHELRNFGVTSCDRAINYAATNALNAAKIFEAALKDNMQLDTIECERSPICRAESDCWDIKLGFFDPENQLTRARKVYRFTIDVSDVCPVTVGAVRSWFVR